MRKLQLMIGVLFVLSLTSCETLNLSLLKDLNLGSLQGLSTSKIIAGLKQALDIGTDTAVKKLSKSGGFSKNKLYRLALPKEMDNVTDTLKSIGLGSLVTSFETKMNEAAEHASSSAGPVFLDAIKGMTFSDAKNILNGPDTAATDYLKKTTSSKLKELYKPIIKKSINEIGVGEIYNQLMDKYDAIPFKSKPKFSLDDYITDRALTAMFSVLGDEEQKIRKDPAARTTELLRQVFGE